MSVFTFLAHLSHLWPFAIGPLADFMFEFKKVNCCLYMYHQDSQDNTGVLEQEMFAVLVQIAQ